jgi:hypothetical protein
VKAQPWQERRREYLEQAGKLRPAKVLVMPSPTRRTASATLEEILDFLKAKREADPRGAA